MPVTLYFPTKAAPTATVTLSASVASITRKERAAVGQAVQLAASGKEYVRKITSNENEVWPMELVYLPTDDLTTGSLITDGKTTLENFILTTLDSMMNTCEVEDPDGNIRTMRYMRGLSTLREGGGQGNTQRTKDQWFGTITWRKVL